MSKRLNRRDHIFFCGTSHDQWEGLWIVRIEKISLKVFQKLTKEQQFKVQIEGAYLY